MAWNFQVQSSVYSLANLFLNACIYRYSFTGYSIQMTAIFLQIINRLVFARV